METSRSSGTSVFLYQIGSSSVSFVGAMPRLVHRLERNTRMKTVEKSSKDTKINCIDNFFGCIINALNRK